MSWTVRYVRADAAGSGDGTTHANSGGTGAFTIAEAITHSTTNTGVQYVISAAGGAYANTTTTRTFSGAGTTTAPNWWRGSNSGTTPADCELDPTLAKPSLTFTTGQVSVTAAHQIFSNLSVSGDTILATALFSVTTGGGNCRFDRLRCINTAAHANGVAFRLSGTAGTVTRCYFSATATASITANFTSENLMSGSIVSGGIVGVSHSAATGVLLNNVIRGSGSHAYTLTAASGRPLVIAGNTIHGAGGDGLLLAALPTSGVLANNIFSAVTGTAINNSTGVNTNLVHRYGNAFYSVGATEAGFGDSPYFDRVLEVSSPFTDAAGGDFSLVTGALSKASGQPGRFENQSYTSYLDRGAVQRQEPAGGGLYRRRIRPLGV